MTIVNQLNIIIPVFYNSNSSKHIACYACLSQTLYTQHEVLVLTLHTSETQAAKSEDPLRLQLPMPGESTSSEAEAKEEAGDSGSHGDLFLLQLSFLW